MSAGIFQSVSASLSRLPKLMLLPVLLPTLLGAGCAKDPCLVADAPVAVLCKCPPRDNELLARLTQTDLPYPVRKVIIQCADAIHKSDAHNVVTKQSLKECVSADASLDAPTKQALAETIDYSNLKEQKDLDSYHAQCLTGPGASTTAAPAAADTAPVAPVEGSPAATAAPAPAPAPTPTAAPAPAPAPIK